MMTSPQNKKENYSSHALPYDFRFRRLTKTKLHLSDHLSSAVVLFCVAKLLHMLNGQVAKYIANVELKGISADLENLIRRNAFLLSKKGSEKSDGSTDRIKYWFFSFCIHNRMCAK